MIAKTVVNRNSNGNENDRNTVSSINSISNVSSIERIGSIPDQQFEWVFAMLIRITVPIILLTVLIPC